MKSYQENLLFITDLQIPFEHHKALKFCVQVKKHFKITDENVYNVGDEIDQYFGGLWKKSPEARHTPNSEIAESINKLKRWYRAFPTMKLCISNHGTRYWRKALEAEIPSQMLRRYEEVIQAPLGWKWQKRWIIKAPKQQILCEHGDDWGGRFPHVDAAMHNGMSTVIGQHHTKAGVHFLKTAMLDIWCAVGGSLIDFEQYAFEYARNAKLKPQIGVIVVVNGGKTPYFLPLE